MITVIGIAYDRQGNLRVALTLYEHEFGLKADDGAESLKMLLTTPSNVTVKADSIIAKPNETNGMHVWLKNNHGYVMLELDADAVLFFDAAFMSYATKATHINTRTVINRRDKS